MATRYPILDDAAHLRESDLAARWQVSHRTLQRWRSEHYGPAWLTIGGSIRYRMADVVAWETAMRQAGNRS